MYQKRCFNVITSCDGEALVKANATKVTLFQESFFADEPICVRVFLYSVAPFPLRFSKLSLRFSNPSYDSHCVLIDAAVGSEVNSFNPVFGDQPTTLVDEFFFYDRIFNLFGLKSQLFFRVKVRIIAPSIFSRFL